MKQFLLSGPAVVETKELDALEGGGMCWNLRATVRDPAVLWKGKKGLRFPVRQIPLLPIWSLRTPSVMHPYAAGASNREHFQGEETTLGEQIKISSAVESKAFIANTVELD